MSTCKLRNGDPNFSEIGTKYRPLATKMDTKLRSMKFRQRKIKIAA